MCPNAYQNFGIISDPLFIRSALFGLLCGSYKTPRVCGLPHTFAQSVEAGRYCDAGVSSALFLLKMGHVRRRRRPKRLAEKLLQIREALGLSQCEMAERLGNERTRNIISNYERNKSIKVLFVKRL